MSVALRAEIGAVCSGHDWSGVGARGEGHERTGSSQEKGGESAGAERESGQRAGGTGTKLCEDNESTEEQGRAVSGPIRVTRNRALRDQPRPSDASQGTVPLRARPAVVAPCVALGPCMPVRTVSLLAPRCWWCCDEKRQAESCESSEAELSRRQRLTM